MKIVFTLFLFSSLCKVYIAGQVVNLYSAQKEHLIRPVLDKFTETSGIKVRMITGKAAGLVTRIEREGKYSPVDVLLTTDIGNIYQAKTKGLLQPVQSSILQNNIPKYLRGPDNDWFGFTMRARVLFFNKDHLPKTPINYLSVSDRSLVKDVLIRSSSNVYNQSLMAYILHHYGWKKARRWAKGIVKNMARKPQGGDRDQIRAVASGEGKVAIANSYYYGVMVDKARPTFNQNVNESTAIIFPQDKAGVHVNIRGGGLATHAKNRENGIKLLEFLSTESAQKLFTKLNLEYPVNPRVKPAPLLESWGNFKKDQTSLEVIGALQPKAIAIMDWAGWK